MHVFVTDKLFATIPDANNHAPLQCALDDWLWDWMMGSRRQHPSNIAGGVRRKASWFGFSEIGTG